MQSIYSICYLKNERDDYAAHQVWRSAGMAEVA